MIIDTKGLSDAIAQANELSSKPNLTKQEERRYNFLLSCISANQERRVVQRRVSSL